MSGRRRGFTLLELLVVVVILAAVATTAVSLLDKVDLQARFDDSRTRLNATRDAIAGPDRNLNGHRELSGFVSDLGSLPADVSELLAQGTLPAWQLDPATGLGAGWRGPYLRADGAGNFRDGHGNAFGWQLLDSGTRLRVTSHGSDGPTGTGTEWHEVDQSVDVAPDDWLVPVDGFSVTVTFSNPTGTAWADTVRVRVLAPDRGVLPSYPATVAERDGASFLSLARAVAVPAGATVSVVFTFAAPPAVKRLPTGLRTLVLVRESDGSIVNTTGLSVPAPIALAPRASLVPATLAWTVP